MSNVISLPGHHYGAWDEDWQGFIDGSLVHAVLPIVCNPTAQIDAKSAIKSVGKVPCVYNSAGRVVGLTGWTTRRTSLAELSQWRATPDIGAGINAAYVQALDIDVHDRTLSARIRAFSRAYLDLICGPIPLRYRTNSGKCLLAFIVDDSPAPMRKRILKVDGGIVEFLATGQQFVVVGTHTSGVRYQWGDPDAPEYDGYGEYLDRYAAPIKFPHIPYTVFELFWSALVKKFGIEPPTECRESHTRPARRSAQTATPDPIADFLEENSYVKSYHHDGRYNIICPFDDSHTSESAESATQYFPSGIGGYVNGHFKCLHAHCAHRTDRDYLDKIGFGEGDFLDEFENQKPKPPEQKPNDQKKPPINNAAIAGRTFYELQTMGENSPLYVHYKEPPVFARDKSGQIPTTPTALHDALFYSGVLNMALSYDQFADEILIAEMYSSEWRVFSDNDYAELKLRLDKRGFKKVPHDMLRENVMYVARENTFDSALMWLNSLTWDGVPRIDKFLIEYCGVDESLYAIAVSRYLWTALAGRVLTPGCQADMVPVLTGEQGLGKSRLIAALVPSQEYYVEVSLADRDADLSRRMKGRIVAEISELRGFNAKDQESIKAFITRTTEDWIPKFFEKAARYKRRLLFIGTTNEREILTDPTGNRRWLPLSCERKIDVEGVVKIRDQLWAEATHVYNAGGIAWQAAETLAAQVHGEYTAHDPWLEPIAYFLDGRDDDTPEGATRGDGIITTNAIATRALGMQSQSVTRGVQMRVGAVMRSLGYTSQRVVIGYNGNRFVADQVRMRGWTRKPAGQGLI